MQPRQDEWLAFDQHQPRQLAEIPVETAIELQPRRYARDELLAQAIIASDAELWWVRDTQSGVEFAIDRAEYERLFADQPILPPVLGDALYGTPESLAAMTPEALRAHAANCMSPSGSIISVAG